MDKKFYYGNVAKEIKENSLKIKCQIIRNTPVNDRPWYEIVVYGSLKGIAGTAKSAYEALYDYLLTHYPNMSYDIEFIEDIA